MGDFIKIDQELFNHSFWNKKRVFSEFEAFIDLVKSAKTEDCIEIGDNKSVFLKKGEQTYSLKTLEKKWNWGNTKVRSFIKKITLEKLVTIRTTEQSPTQSPTQLPTQLATHLPTQLKNVVTILKYDSYKDSKKPSNTVTNTVTNTVANTVKVAKKAPPSFQEFKAYANSKMENLDEEKLSLKYQSWIENNWKTGAGRQIKNWKSTLLNTLSYLKKDNNNNYTKQNEPRINRQTAEDVRSNMQGWR